MMFRKLEVESNPGPYEKIRPVPGLIPAVLTEINHPQVTETCQYNENQTAERREGSKFAKLPISQPMNNNQQNTGIMNRLVSQTIMGLAAPQLKRLVAGFPPRRPGFNPGSGQVGFVVDKVALGQVFSEYFGFPCHSFHQILHPHNHPGQVQ
jgi:hypothetical protein